MAIPSRRLAALPAICAAALTILLYAWSIPGPYIYDDVQIIGTDTRIHNPRQWGQLWTKDYFNGGVDNLYRPLTSTSYALQWWINGDRPWAFRLVNMLLAAAACAAVAELARRLAGFKAALAAGLLFAAHPVHVEAVVGIVGRAEQLCTLFIACGLALFLRRPLTLGRAFAIAGCSVAAMLSKEQGMLFPFLILALGLLPPRRPQSPPEKQSMLLLTLTLSLTLAALIDVREEVLNLKFEWDKVFLDESIQPLARSSPADHALIVFSLLGRYAQLMIAPVKLSIDYGLSVLSSKADWHDPYLYAGFATALAGLTALLIELRKKHWPAAFCLIAAALTYGMVSNIMLIGTIFAERLIYLPSAFLLIWLSIHLARLRRATLAATLAVLLVLAGARTVSYAVRWNDRLSFYETSLAEQPNSVRLRELVITELMSRNDWPAAARQAAEGRRITPEYWNIWAVSGKIAEAQGNLPEALAMYRQTLKLHPLVTLSNLTKELQSRIDNARATTAPATTQ